MARTRAEIKTLIHGNTGRTKDTLESSKCDSALKVAIQNHAFWESITDTYTDFALTEADESEDISSASPEHVVTATIVETDGSRNLPLILKNRIWWAKRVVNASDNTQGWPKYGMYISGVMYFDRPVQSGLTLRVRVSTAQTFATDATECPIAALDIFVEEFVTAEVFLALGQMDSYYAWRRKALGGKYDADGTVGGSLLKAINFDKFGLGEELEMEPPIGLNDARFGLSILNSIDGHPREGFTDWWF